jgi:hypothetical protein
MGSEDNAPPLLDVTLELGLTRMQQLVGDSEDEIYRPRICLVVDSKSAMIIAMEMGKLGEDELAVAGRALNETFARIKGVPRQIITRKPDVAAMLKENLQQFGVEVLVRESLPAAEEALQAIQSSGPLAGPAEPSMIKTPGITLDHLIDFAEAGDLFYKAAPWQHLTDDDAIQIHSPAGPKGTAFAQVLGAAGQVMGLGFVSSLEEHENLQAGGGLPDKPVWNLLYGTLDELPCDDGELWETHSLPAANADAYPLFKRFSAKRKVSLPKPKELAWAEGLLRALAATTEDELDSGRWEKSVKTSEGPAVYSFSLPILLEQMQERKSTCARNRNAINCQVRTGTLLGRDGCAWPPAGAVGPAGPENRSRLLRCATDPRQPLYRCRGPNPNAAKCRLLGGAATGCQGIPGIRRAFLGFQ